MSLSLLIEQAIDRRLRDIPQTLLCTIESYDKDSMRATVKPLYRSVNSSGKEIDYPLLSKIPVMSCYLGKDISIIPSYERGDLVLVAFSTFDFSKQLTGISAKESEGLFGKENSFVIGGIKPNVATNKDLEISFEDGSILLKNKNTSIEIKETDIEITTQSGTFSLGTHTHTGNLGAQTSNPTTGS
jgi:hypothetical protein